MNTKFKLILSPKNDAKTNMQIDKDLLNLFVETEPLLRIYSWNPSFSVGASQKCEDYPELLSKFNNNCAKRITGGGVLIHGFDISYSLILPSFWYADFSVKQSYEQICKFLLKFYANLNLYAKFAKDLNLNLTKTEFCQVGFEAYDIIINGKKIGGNAQKRTKNIIFQHGSIPIFDTFDKKNEGYSLKDFNINLSLEMAKDMLIQAFKESFNANFKE